MLMPERAGPRLSPALGGTGTHQPPPHTSSLTLLKLQSPLYDPSTSLELRLPQKPLVETSVTPEPAPKLASTPMGIPQLQVHRGSSCLRLRREGRGCCSHEGRDCSTLALLTLLSLLCELDPNENCGIQ